MKSLRLLLAALAVVTAVLADHHEHDKDHDHEPTHEEIIDKLIERTNQVTHDIYDFDAKLDHRTDPVRIRKAGSLKHRVEELEDEHCSYHTHQCGEDDPQCISDLFVCDGHKDCRNGEDEKHCDLPTKVGDEFEGDVVYDNCTKRKPEHITIHIEAVNIDAFFTAVPEIHAHVEIDTDDDDAHAHASLPADGIYTYAHNQLYLYPPEDDGLAILGTFDGFNFDRFVGEIIHDASHEACAEFIFHRKHHDDDDDDHDDDDHDDHHNGHNGHHKDNGHNGHNGHKDKGHNGHNGHHDKDDHKY